MQDDGALVLISICTRDRPEKLKRLLEAVAGLSVPPGTSVRVQVIDNSPGQSARDTVLRAGTIHGGLAYCHQPEGGIPGARNTAIDQRKEHEHLVFFDDDDWPEQSWLLRVWDVHKADPSAIVAGRKHSVDGKRHDEPAKGPLEDGRRIATCAFSNVLLPAVLLDMHELAFCERYRRSGGEDTDFCFRAAALGVVTRLASTAVCYEDAGRERSRTGYRMKLSFTQGAVYSDILRRQRRVQIPYRLLAIAARALVGLCELPIAAIGNDRKSRALEDISLAIGGLAGLFGYLPRRYP